MKRVIACVLVLFFVSSLQAQYTVLEIKGTVDMSMDKGKTWRPLKEQDILKADYQIKIPANSSVHIADSKMVYRCAGAKTIFVSDITKQRKTVSEVINESQEIRTAVLAVERNGSDGDACKVCLHFKVAGKSNWYDWDFIPEGSVFYITIFNKTKADKIVNVYQELDNEELIPCLPENIHLEKDAVIEFPNIPFVKQENIEFMVVMQEK